MRSTIDESSSEEVIEVQELLNMVGNSITGLFELSTLLRRESSDVTYNTTPIDSQPDIDYIWHKLPYTRSTAPWLVEKLGKANTRRRAYLKYRETQRGKLAYRRPANEIEDDTARDSGQNTIATTNIEDPNLDAEGHVGQADLETRSDTPYSSSAMEDNETKLAMPPRPTGSREKQTFECPYCFTFISTKNDDAWR
jgi:hypothetical protein